MKNKVICNAVRSTSLCGECRFANLHDDEGVKNPCRVNAKATIVPAERWVELICANNLKRCTFLPGSFDKTFVNRINIEPDYKMTDKGRIFMFSLVYKYRKQMVNYQKIRHSCIKYFEVDPENIPK